MLFLAHRAVYPNLEKYFNWFMLTQAGDEPDSFRWRGATKDHTFASGLDDFPRGFVREVKPTAVVGIHCDVATFLRSRAGVEYT